MLKWLGLRLLLFVQNVWNVKVGSLLRLHNSFPREILPLHYHILLRSSMLRFSRQILYLSAVCPECLRVIRGGITPPWNALDPCTDRARAALLSGWEAA